MNEGPSPEAIGRTIFDAFDRLCLEPILRKARPVPFDSLVERLHTQLIAPDPERGVEALLWVLTHAKEYAYQNLAGEILARHPISCTRALEPLLDELLPVFNASARHTVGYLVHCFGRDAVRASVRSRRLTTGPIGRNRSALDCMAYWLGEPGAPAPEPT